MQPPPSRPGLVRSCTLFGLLGLTLLSGSPLESQVRDRAPLLLQLPLSTSALAFGGAFPLAERTSDAVFEHPGVVGRARGAEVGVQLWGEGATGGTASGAFEWWGGAAALGVATLSHHLPPDRAPGEPLTLRSEDGLLGEGPSDGGEGVSELAAVVGYGREVAGIWAGATGSWVERRVEGRRSLTGAVDVGLADEIRGVFVGVAARNLGPGLDREGETLSLPWEVTPGASFSGRPVGPVDLGATAEVAFRADGEAIPAGGIEVAWWPVVGRTFVGRVGFRRVPEGGGDEVGFGAAFYGDAFGLEYAYRGLAGSRATHRIGIRWR